MGKKIYGACTVEFRCYAPALPRGFNQPIAKLFAILFLPLSLAPAFHVLVFYYGLREPRVTDYLEGGHCR